MYEELVNALRETDFSDGCPCVSSEMCKNKDCIILQAADAIEELQKRVPKAPHGRLIDADALCKVLQKNSEDEWNNKIAPFSWAYAYDCVKDTVEIMPTIIPAEPTEDGE